MADTPTPRPTNQRIRKNVPTTKSPKIAEVEAKYNCELSLTLYIFWGHDRRNQLKEDNLPAKEVHVFEVNSSGFRSGRNGYFRFETLYRYLIDKETEYWIEKKDTQNSKAYLPL